MTDFSSISTPARQRPRPRRAGAALALAAAALVGGCSAASSGGTGAQPISPHQAIQLASEQTAKINSMTLNIVEQLGTGSLTGSLRMRLKPTLLMREDLQIAGGGMNSSITAIITGQAIYMKMPQLSNLTRKPWAEITLGQMSSKTGMNLSQLFQQAENMGPQSAGRLFTISRDVHKAGSATVDGVATTEYAGTFNPADAFKQIPVSVTKRMSQMLASLGSSRVSFQVWIDGSNVMRKMVENMNVAGHSVVATIDVTSINQPVSITLPPASQTATIPGL